MGGRLCAGRTAQPLYSRAGKHCAREPANGAPASCSLSRKVPATREHGSILWFASRSVVPRPVWFPQGSPRTTMGTRSPLRKITGCPAAAVSELDAMSVCRAGVALCGCAACRLSDLTRRSENIFVSAGLTNFSILSRSAMCMLMGSRTGRPGSVAKKKKIGPSCVSFADARTGTGLFPCYSGERTSFFMPFVSFFLFFSLAARKSPGCSGLGWELRANRADGSSDWGGEPGARVIPDESKVSGWESLPSQSWCRLSPPLGSRRGH